MKFKYAKEMELIEGCPPPEVSPVTRISFRFVYANMEDDRNFLPVKIKEPARRFKTSEDCCFSYSLSFFESKRQAIAKYEHLKRIARRIRETIGSHLAEGTLAAEDGLATEPDDSGHFELFENKTCDFHGRFNICHEFLS